ncbi:hypothetical protein LWI29_034757 [Acer saccharum]|uniref:Reverse transcriptase domain-containing protein n=1 Tax=Acer saccharum TaxID=4024 RepID=A0AA39RTB0_ACESA|nr:hypothetical protein LWI29_034757 [Acer saccharum]
MAFMNEFYKDGSVVRDLNSTFITLIPKVKRPMMLSDYRPISLVGSMYKVVAKVLANRLRRVMNSVIGDYQMAFIEGRQILDSVVVVEEIINKWKHEEEGGCGIQD